MQRLYAHGHEADGEGVPPGRKNKAHDDRTNAHFERDGRRCWKNP